MNDYHLNKWDWLAIRKSAIAWVEQVHNGEPGPEPLLSEVEALCTRAIREALARRAADERYDGLS